MTNRTTVTGGLAACELYIDRCVSNDAYINDDGPNKSAVLFAYASFGPVMTLKTSLHSMTQF